jgi:hypothetical protein
MDEIYSSETSDCLQTTWHYKQEDHSLLIHLRETLKSNILGLIFLSVVCFDPYNIIFSTLFLFVIHAVIIGSLFD